MWFSREPSVIREAVRRGVKLLLHSTHLYKNLPQILADGTLHTAGSLRQKFGDEHAARFLHDPRRYESFRVGLDYLNASLSVPNFELLYHRSKSAWPQEWVHLDLDLSLISRDDTLFCPVSAAAQFGERVQAGRAGFLALFENSVDGFSRENLPRNIPTHPQAEILLAGPLPLSNIRGILVSSPGIHAEVERLCEFYHRSLNIELAPYLFVWPKRLMKN